MMFGENIVKEIAVLQQLSHDVDVGRVLQSLDELDDAGVVH